MGFMQEETFYSHQDIIDLVKYLILQNSGSNITIIWLTCGDLCEYAFKLLLLVMTVTVIIMTVIIGFEIIFYGELCNIL